MAILGSGPAGLTLASKLNSDCVVIESGHWDLDLKNHREFHSINSGEPTDIDSVRLRGVGGASLRWSGRCIALDDYDFEDREWIAEAGWPIARHDLDDHYAEALRLLGIDETENPRFANHMPLGEATRHDRELRHCTWLFADRKPGGMVRFGKKFRGEFTRPGKHLIYGAHCVDVVQEGEAVRALKVIDRANRMRTIKARRFVIASGCVETCRLLLAHDRANPAALGKVRAWLGRGFMQHLRLDAGSVRSDPGQFHPLQRMLNIFHKPGHNSQEFGLSLEPAFAREKKVGNASIILRYVPERGLSPLDWTPSIMGRLLGRTPHLRRAKVMVEIDTEQAVSPSSFISLAEQKDKYGQPRALVHWVIDEVDRRTGFEAMRAFGRFLQRHELGLLDECQEISPDAISSHCRRDTLHQLGGTRMSDSAATGVVDRDLKVHGTANLWVVGGSVFSTGGHANPTLTIMALANRLAHHLGKVSSAR
ncbi:GMC oxidoreductase [Aurantiacibacter suaedae]|uniref:GMC oxidoreductase n=1 Tax=Aurantiacibacter suaedae TaxID=2545755 RepID=UPI0010F9EF24|nr:GMC oxidoreductase [Aurantiacibacter suaedae]